MKSTLHPVRRDEGGKPFHRARPDCRPETQRPDGQPARVQLIYAHLPPATILATRQHLRAQTRIEQRAQQLWFTGKARSADALNHWLRAEQEVVRELCAALRPSPVSQPGQPEPAPIPFPAEQPSNPIPRGEC